VFFFWGERAEKKIHPSVFLDKLEIIRKSRLNHTSNMGWGKRWGGFRTEIPHNLR